MFRYVFIELCDIRYTKPPRYFIYCRSADKSLARPGRKQTWKHVRYARDFNIIETWAVTKFFFSSCKARRRRKFTPFWQKHYPVSSLVELRTSQHPCIYEPCEVRRSEIYTLLTGVNHPALVLEFFFQFGDNWVQEVTTKIERVPWNSSELK